jgi:hypothetical protein
VGTDGTIGPAQFFKEIAGRFVIVEMLIDSGEIESVTII